MTALPTVVKDSHGNSIRLGRRLGKGGEGAVFEVDNKSSIAIKLYWPNKAAARREKIGAMVAAGWHKTNSFVAFPADVLFNPNGSFAGFLMKKIGGHKPIHQLYSPSSRKAEFSGVTFPFLVRTAVNAARAVASVHADSCVIGDVNHSGFLVSDKATVTLIDSDSFQVVASGRYFLCSVATPDYTPPELQGAKFDQTNRTANHDNFGLAVLIFQLLFMGRHPYSGRYSGPGDMPLERAIKEFRFAYSKQTNQMQPPPGVPLLIDFPDYIEAAFERAFGREGLRQRPSAEEWISVLTRLEAELQKCTSQLPHHHVRSKACPWCRMEAAFPGFLAFATGTRLPPLSSRIDSGQFVALINAIPDPGPAPSIQGILRPVAITVAAPEIASDTRRRYGLSIVAASGGLFLALAGIPGLWTYALSGGAILAAFVPSKERTKALESKRLADGAWKNIQEDWARQAGNEKYRELKDGAQGLIQHLNGLPAEERRALQDLEKRKRESQLNRYLERFTIESARIKKIGAARKATLASFGIETAADVTRNQIQAIQGFGPTLVDALLAWRRALEARFVFNPNEPINPADIAAAKARIFAKKSDIERKLRSTVSGLRQATSYAIDQRNALSASINSTHRRLKQSEFDEAATLPPLAKTVRLLSVVFLGIGLFAHGALKDAGRYSASYTVPDRVQQAPVSIKPNRPSVPTTTKIDPKLPTPSAAAIPSPLVFPRGAPILPNPESKTPLVAPTPDRPEAASAPEAPALPPPIEIGNKSETEVDAAAEPSEPAPDGSAKLSLADPADVKVVQNRLYELGYISSRPDGIWGPRSRQALTEFKNANTLGPGDSYDLRIERRLLSDAATRSPGLSFVGNWTPEPGACQGPAGGVPLRITAEWADAGEGYCRFDSIAPETPGSWRIRGRCFGQNKSWPATIRLTLMGERLRWQSEKGMVEYYRCG